MDTPIFLTLPALVLSQTESKYQGIFPEEKQPINICQQYILSTS